MIFQDNVLKEYLKNVYFITGTPCGGKTTISRELAKKYNLTVYDIDEQFENHLMNSNSVYQPSMNTQFKNADEFFGRTVEEYKKWLLDNTREQLDFVILDLIRLSQNQVVLC
ncbi:MAG: AAA family ATPase, partial [Clostridia bacterium]|nr:AAA family ATPase [Clostridia bacterium]